MLSSPTKTTNASTSPVLTEGGAGDELVAGPPPLPMASAFTMVSGLRSLLLDLGLVLDGNLVVPVGEEGGGAVGVS